MSWICPKCETENPDRLKVCEVCDSPRESSPVDELKSRLKEKYSGEAYRKLIQYHRNLLEAADKEDAGAQYQVGDWFFEQRSSGKSVKYDSIGVVWLKKAAEQGHTMAQYKLASCYEEGRGIFKSRDEAMKWYQEAAKKGDKVAMYKYSKLKYNNKTYEGVIKYRLSLLHSADNGNSDSQYQLAEWFSNHSSQSAYREEAVVWYTKAAEKGHAEAMYKLGDCYENGTGVIKYYNQAVEWYKKAANAGNENACLRLTKAYLNGYMVEKDVGEAVKWYELVGRGLNASELCIIGYSYDTGDTVPVNNSKAVEYYRKAAEMGNAEAQYRMGLHYEQGSGVDINITTAFYWYEKDASQENIHAKNCINRIQNPHEDDVIGWMIIYGAGLLGSYCFLNSIVDEGMLNNVIPSLSTFRDIILFGISCGVAWLVCTIMKKIQEL